MDDTTATQKLHKTLKTAIGNISSRTSTQFKPLSLLEPNTNVKQCICASLALNSNLDTFVRSAFISRKTRILSFITYIM